MKTTYPTFIAILILVFGHGLSHSQDIAEPEFNFHSETHKKVSKHPTIKSYLPDSERLLPPSSEGWFQVGDLGFSDLVSVGEIVAEVDPSTGDIYAVMVSEEDLAHTFKYDGTEWAEIGSPVPSITAYFDLAINPSTGNPWLITHAPNSSIGKIYSLENNEWVQVGQNINTFGFSNIEFTSAGEAYVVTVGSEPVVSVYTYVLNGTEWENLGPLVLSGAEYFLRFEITQNDEFFMLFTSPTPFDAFGKCSKYEENEWNQIGDEINGESFVSIQSNKKLQIAVTDDNNLYAALAHSDSLTIYQWSEDSWEVISNNISNGVIQNFDIELDNMGNLYAIYQNELSSINCEKWDGNTWQNVGIPNITPEIEWLDLVIFSNQLPGVLYTDMSVNGRLSFQRFSNSLTTTDSENSDDLMLFPNPGNGLYTIQAGNATHLKIFDSTGKLIRTLQLKGNSAEYNFDLNDLESGVYIVRFENNSTFIGSRRLVKN